MGYPRSSEGWLKPGERFTLRLTVHNQGNGQAGPTTLRYYRSSDITINSSDTPVGTAAVSGLSALGAGTDSSAESVTLTAASSGGGYYYGACVDSVSGESNEANNCSPGVRLFVSEDEPSATLSSSTCSGWEVSSDSWDITMEGRLTAHRPLSDVTATLYIQPGTRRVGSQFLGSLAVDETKSVSIAGTVSGATPVSCEGDLEESLGALRISVPLERAESRPDSD